MIAKNKIFFARNLRKQQTNAEKLLWHHLRNSQLSNIKFRRQQAMGLFIVDFIALKHKLIIELDGGQHNEDNVIKKDKQRTEWLENEGFEVIRFWDNEVLKDTNSALEKIEQTLTLALSPNGRGEK